MVLDTRAPGNGGPLFCLRSGKSRDGPGSRTKESLQPPGMTGGDVWHGARSSSRA